MKKVWVTFFALILLLNCSDDEDISGVNIRLSNISSINFENAIVDTSTGKVSYGLLNAGSFSDYRSFDIAYRYAFVELVSDGKTYTYQPIDYVGETPLGNGNYTYQLDIDEQNEFVFLVLVKD